MKNLKRTLALVLCVVMLAGVLGISAFAKSYTEFPDADDVNYVEAVDLLTGLGIVQGNELGKLDPQGYYTREQAAKIVAYILVGATAADRLGATTQTFTDVATNRWSAGYIALGVTRGILSGYPDGSFKPANKLTGYEFGKMLLAAIGYGAKGEFTGNNWAANVADLGINLGIYSRVLGAASSNYLTREEAMQMAYNALTLVDMVKYSESFDIYYTGTTVFDAINTAQSLGEKYYGLVAAPTSDDLGFGGYKWKSFGKVVSDFYQTDVTVATYNGGTYASTITKAYPMTAFERDGTSGGSIQYISNGDLKATYTQAAASTAVGSLVMIPFGTTVSLVDSNLNGLVDKIVVRTEYAAQVASVNTVMGTSVVNVFAGPTSYAVTVETTEYAQYTFLTVVPYGDMPALAASEGFISVEKATVVTSSATDRQNFGGLYSTLKIDGTTYNTTPVVNASALTLGTKYAYVINSFGNVAYVAAYADFTPDTYGLILAYQWTGDLSIWGGAGATSKVLMMDASGEIKQYDVVDAVYGMPSKLDATGGILAAGSNGILVKYRLNANGAINSLQAGTASTANDTPNPASAKFGTGVDNFFVTSNTVFFLYNTAYPYSAFNAPKVVKGYASVPRIATAFDYFKTATGTNDAFTAVLIKAGTSAPVVNLGFVYGAAGDTIVNGTTYNKYNVFVGGETQTLITTATVTINKPYNINTVNGVTTFTAPTLADAAAQKIELSDSTYIKLENVANPVMFAASGCKVYEMTFNSAFSMFTAAKEVSTIATTPSGYTAYAFVVVNGSNQATTIYYWFA